MKKFYYSTTITTGIQYVALIFSLAAMASMAAADGSCGAMVNCQGLQSDRWSAEY